MKNKGYILITMSGVFWGWIGFFVNGLINNGLTSAQVAFVRLFLGFLILFSYSFLKMPQSLKITKKGLIYSVIIGFICQAMFNLCYFNSIENVGVSIAAVLLYTSPLFVALFSKIAFNETFDKYKILSLIICSVGAFIAVTGGSFNFSSLNFVGLILGLGASITYAFMPIISKKALSECKSITIIMYGFLFGTLFMIPIAKPLSIFNHINNMETIFLMFGLGLIPASLAYICYVSGISTGIDLSKVGIISSVELVVSELIGWIIIGENFSYVKFFGVCLMILSAIVVSLSKPINSSLTNKSDLINYSKSI